MGGASLGCLHVQRVSLIAEGMVPFALGSHVYIPNQLQLVAFK